MAVRKKTKLRIIGLLMVIVLIKLAGFSIQWLKTQYADAENNLVIAFSNDYTKIKQQYFDKAFSNILLSPNPEQDSSTRSKIHFTSVKKQSSIIKDTLPEKQSFGQRHSEVKIVTTTQTDSFTSDMANFVSDSVCIPLQLGKQEHISIRPDNSLDTAMVTTAIINIVNSIGIHNLQVKIDTSGMQARIREQADKSYSGLEVLFRKKEKKDDIEISKSGNSRETPLTLGNTRNYLLKKLLPEISSIIILWLLCASSFIISYLTIRQQYRLAEQKNDFISNMSHELKTPVTTAQLALEALTKFDLLNDRQKTRDYLQIASQQLQRLELLVSSVLNNSQMEEGKIVFQKEPIPLKQFLLQLLQQFEPACKEQNKHIDQDLPEEELLIHGDRLQLEGALHNIIDNALKYGNRLIKISLQHENNHAVIHIEDDGKGIPAKYKHKIFEKFFRIPTGNEHLVKGYGLGLHYAQDVLKAHEANISVLDSDLGGADFVLSIPLLTTNEN